MCPPPKPPTMAELVLRFVMDDIARNGTYREYFPEGDSPYTLAAYPHLRQGGQ